MVDAARRGGWVGPETAMGMAELEVTRDPGRRVRAELVRELLMGRLGELDPRGLRVQHVRVVGQLDLDHVTAVTGLSLIGCALPDGVSCFQARLREVNLTECHISGLLADGLHTEGNLFLRNATVTGAGELGAVRLLGAHVGGQLNLRRAVVTNDEGPALEAEDLRTDAGAFLRDATFHGADEQGAVRLFGAVVGGQLDLSRAVLGNGSGPALVGDNLRTEGSLVLQDVTATAAGDAGGVRLAGAVVGGRLIMNGLRVTGGSAPLVVLGEARITAALALPASVVCPAAGVATGRRGCPHGERRMVVRGLVFPELAGVSWRQWLHLLTHHTPSYAPQPFQQLAAVERAAGHDNNARHVLIAQQEDLRRRAPDALGGWLGRWRHRSWGWLGRYGYRAHRVVAALAVVLAVAGGLGYVAGQVPTRPGHYAAERVASAVADGAGTRCSTAELIGLGIDRGLPLGATGLRARCDLDTGTRRGQAFTYAVWLLQAMVWALATLALASYTGLVRKPG